jgi:hypothetical protein
MELTLEAYRNILENVDSQADIASLCGVSRGFQRVAERALYSTLFMRNDEETIILCKTLATSPHLAVHVDALTIYLPEEEYESSDSDANSFIQDQPPPTRAMDWAALAGALQRMTKLRVFNVHINDGSSTSTAWVLDGCTFQLRRFHCDFDWDQKLVAFLDIQAELEDLYILDYKENEDSDAPTASESTFQALHLGSHAIHRLSVLECTFSEAAVALVPGRPITHLKTCFSQTGPIAKLEEMRSLLLNVGLSTQALRSIDIADGSYMQSFSSELLVAIAKVGSLGTELRHLGTLVLPIEGKEVCVCFSVFQDPSQANNICLVFQSVSDFMGS